MRRTRGGAVLVAGALFCACASAAEQGAATGEFRYGLSVGATRSDNAGRTIGDLEESETSYEAGLTAGIQVDRPRTSLALDADLRYQTHSYSDYSDQLAGTLVGEAAWRVLNETLTWFIEDHFGQSLIEPRNTATPGNTQNTNVFSTGPNITIPLGARTALVAQGRWSAVSYEDSDFDSERIAGSAGLEFRMSERSSLSLMGSTTSASYRDLPSSFDYDQHSAFLVLGARGARTRMELRGGYSKVEDSENSTDGATLAVEINRTLSARSSVALHAGREYGDAADAFSRDLDIGGGGERPATVSAGSQRSDYASLVFRTERRRSSLDATLDWRRENPRGDDATNRRSRTATARVSRRVSPRFDVDLRTGYMDEIFTGQVEFSEWNVGAGVNFAFTPAAGISATWDHYVGTGDTALGPETRDYTENRYALRLNWSPRQ